eukprot:5080176-Prymnesium_polylepis.1
MHELVPPLLPSSGTARVKVLAPVVAMDQNSRHLPRTGKRECRGQCGTTDPGSPRAGPRLASFDLKKH